MDDLNIEEDRIYKYLGVIFASVGSFTELVNTLKDKANKAYYSIIARSKEWQRFNPKTFFHVFYHTIVPILNYGAEVWRGKDWTELEKLHLSACKYILGVSHSTPTDGIYAELGRHPLHISRKIVIAKYLKRLLGLSEDRLVHIPNFGGLAGSEGFACATAVPTTPLDFQRKIKNFCHPSLLKTRFKITVTPPPQKKMGKVKITVLQ